MGPRGIEPTHHFDITLPCALPAREAFDRLVDLRAHDAIIPLTRINEAALTRPMQRGDSFVARTGGRRLGFDDAMTVVEFDPPRGESAGRAAFVKAGPVLFGRANLVVTPTPAGGPTTPGCTVRWRQSYRLRALPAAAHPVLGRLLAKGYRRVLRALLARAPQVP